METGMNGDRDEWRQGWMETGMNGDRDEWRQG